MISSYYNDNMIIKFKCSKKEFPNIDMFLHRQEYTKLPDFDMVLFQVDVDGDIYEYCIHRELNNKYYLVTK